jgi:hypothetical protein
MTQIALERSSTMITYLNITGGVLQGVTVLRTPKDLDKLIAELQQYEPDPEEDDDALVLDDGDIIKLVQFDAGKWVWDIPADDPNFYGTPLPELRAMCAPYLQAPQVVIAEGVDGHSTCWSNVPNLDVWFTDYDQPELPEGFVEVYDA